MSMNFDQARFAMIEQQVRPWDVLDPRVLEAMTSVRREDFVADAHRNLAFADLQLPLAHGEAMLKPVVEGRLLQALALAPTDDVLEIGTGSGFLTACLGRLARDVVSLEIHADLAESARARLAQIGVDGNVRIESTDAFGYQATRQFDAICVSAAVDALPQHFMQWLRPGGRMFLVQGRAPAMKAVLVHNDVNGPRIESLFETVLPYLAGAAPTPEFQF